MHIKGNDSDFAALLKAVETMGLRQLGELQEAMDRRRGDLRGSAVLERQDYRYGVLQLETRAYRRKDGGVTRRGPYWYFHYREGGRQRTLYVGKTEAPKRTVAEKLGREE